MKTDDVKLKVISIQPPVVFALNATALTFPDPFIRNGPVPPIFVIDAAVVAFLNSPSKVQNFVFSSGLPPITYPYTKLTQLLDAPKFVVTDDPDPVLPRAVTPTLVEELPPCAIITA